MTSFRTFTAGVSLEDLTILDCQDDQPPQRESELLPSGQVFRAAVCRTKRLRVSFIHCATDMLN